MTVLSFIILPLVKMKKIVQNITLIKLDKTSHPLNQEVVHYSHKWIAQIHKSTVNNLSLCKEPMTWIFYATRNVPKSYTMQVMWGVYARITN